MLRRLRHFKLERKNIMPEGRKEERIEMNIYENIPETVKVSTAVGPAALSLYGLPIEQWVFILSAVVSILVIVEKLPKAIQAIRNMYQWIIGKRNDPSE